MTYIITGGLGYLGFTLVNDLLRKTSAQIIVIDSESPREFFQGNPRIKVHQGDISDREFLASIQLPSDTKGAFHLAAKKSVSESLLKPNEYMKVNLEGTRNILEFCQKMESKILSLHRVQPFTKGSKIYLQLMSHPTWTQVVLMESLN